MALRNRVMKFRRASVDNGDELVPDSLQGVTKHSDIVQAGNDHHVPDFLPGYGVLY